MILTHTRLNILQLPPFLFIGGNTVYVDTFALMRTIAITTDGSGQGSTALPIPPDPGLLGQMFATQVVLLDAGNPFGGVLSNAALLALGDIPPFEEPLYQTLTSPIGPGNPLFDQMAGSPLTAEFAVAVETEGLGTLSMDAAYEITLAGNITALGPIPPDVRIAIVPVFNNTPLPKGAVYMFTTGTHPMLGLVEGADVMEFVKGMSGEIEALRIYMDATDFGTYAEIGIGPTGLATPAAATGTATYLLCFVAAINNKINLGTLTGLTAACKAFCAACVTPAGVNARSCALCAACVSFAELVVIGCWWGC